MILKNKSEISDFVHAAEKCAGEVFFEDEQGDRLNLKSELSQFVFAVILFKMEDMEYWIRFDERDNDILLPYLQEKDEN